MEALNKPVLEVENLSTNFHTQSGTIRAIKNVNFFLEEKKCLALIGESGAGKSVTGLSLMNLIPKPGRVVSGRVMLQEDIDKQTELLRLSPRQMRSVRGEKMAMVFQDSLASFNPVMTIGRQITQMVSAHRHLSNREAENLVLEKLSQVGLPARRALKSYPFQLSGGMRQRAAMAMALALHPRVIIADEPTTSLDATLQLQVLTELKKQLEECCSTLLFITHDLAAASVIASDIAILYGGMMVEYGPARELLTNPLHPYSRALLNSHPSFCVNRRLKPIGGSPPDPLDMPDGCPFHPRCPEAHQLCREETPAWKEAGGNHRVACFQVE